jgi:hypothetical protein
MCQLVCTESLMKSIRAPSSEVPGPGRVSRTIEASAGRRRGGRPACRQEQLGVRRGTDTSGPWRSLQRVARLDMHRTTECGCSTVTPNVKPENGSSPRSGVRIAVLWKRQQAQRGPAGRVGTAAAVHLRGGEQIVSSPGAEDET